MNRLIANVLLFIAILIILPVKNAASQVKVDISFWSQAWYQHVENGKEDNGLNDFMVRRAYLSVKGQP